MICFVFMYCKHGWSINSVWKIVFNILHIIIVNSIFLFFPIKLILCRPSVPVGKVEASLSSSSLSVQDVLRQRYSVTWHPRLLYLIVSDGYMVTVMRLLDRPTPAFLIKSLLKDTSKDLEKAFRKLDKSQVVNKKPLEIGKASASVWIFYKAFLLNALFVFFVFRFIWGHGWNVYLAWTLTAALRCWTSLLRAGLQRQNLWYQ